MEGEATVADPPAADVAATGNALEEVHVVGDVSLMLEEPTSVLETLWPVPEHSKEDEEAGSTGDAQGVAERREVEEVKGLTTEEAERLQRSIGFNEIVSRPRPKILVILSYFVGVIPITMLLTAILAAALPEEDELLFIVFVEYLSDKNTGNAISEVKKLNCPTCQCRRDGEWKALPTRELVPGDICALSGGTIIPADGVLTGEGLPILVDEASLTGEALAVAKGVGESVLQGAVVQSGELYLRVERTGPNTLFGKALELLGSTESSGNIKKVLEKTARLICGVGTVFCLILMLISIFRDHVPWYRALAFSMALLCTVLPSAMPMVTAAVLSVGALELSAEKAVVTRLSSIEELAGMRILCSDKTGTLTLNKLSIEKEEVSRMAQNHLPAHLGGSTEVVENEGYSKAQVLFFAALASKRENHEPIDKAILETLGKEAEADLDKYKILRFVPFNPTDKRTEATVCFPDGQVKIVTKGAPQVILRLLGERSAAVRANFESIINKQAERGLRTLGVAIFNTYPVACGEDDFIKSEAELVGLISMFDPPREDTASTIQRAMELGIDVKMITGDQRAIAVETCRRLGLGTNVLGEEVWCNDSELVVKAGGLGKLVQSVNGFAQVNPEHKYKIVSALQQEKHMVGMTGDGVNDAPALKKADVGIAVAGASDAAKAAADIILLEPGLSTIVKALVISRCIFRRLRNYVVFRVGTSLLTLLLFWLASVLKTVSPPLWSLLLLKTLNDVTMMATSKDRVISSRKPDKWDGTEICSISCALGVTGGLACIIFSLLAAPENQAHMNFWNAWGCTPLTQAQLNLAVFLLAGILIQLSLFSARTTGFFFIFDEKTAAAPSLIVIGCSACAVTFTTIFSVYFPQKWADAISGSTNTGVLGIGWKAAGVVWTFAIIWFFAEDLLKVLVVKCLIGSDRRFQFLRHHEGRKDSNASKIMNMTRKEAQRMNYKDGIAVVLDKQQKVLDYYRRCSMERSATAVSNASQAEIKRNELKPLQASFGTSCSFLPAASQDVVGSEFSPEMLKKLQAQIACVAKVLETITRCKEALEREAHYAHGASGSPEPGSRDTIELDVAQP